MARGGINKALVAQAREAVLAKGENPSIDAVRVELGNTGSKSTIHRYLKELEEEASSRLDDEALLSQPIKELIARLASRLQEEARGIVSESRSRYELRITELSERCAELTYKAGEAVSGQNALEIQLNEAREELALRSVERDALDKQLTQAKLQETNLAGLLREKQMQIDSLKEKHRHSREALEHYRQSVKEQRDQDHRRHEQQIQQLQAEIRTLNQAISVKQGDLTQLNKDNARLVSELGAARKEVQDFQTKLNTASAKLEDVRGRLQTQASELSRCEGSAERQSLQISELTQRVESLQSEIRNFAVNQARLEAEVSVKNDMIERLMTEKRNVKDAPAE